MHIMFVCRCVLLVLWAVHVLQRNYCDAGAEGRLNSTVLNVTELFVAHSVKLDAVAAAIVVLAKAEPLLQWINLQSDADKIDFLTQSKAPRVHVPAGE